MPLEKPDQHNDSHLRAMDVRRFCANVREDMLQRNPSKYGAFLRSMEMVIAIVSFLPEGRMRGNFLRAYYMLMRHLDDIADGDRPLPEGNQSATALLDELMEFSAAWQRGEQPAPRTFLQGLLAYCLRFAGNFDEDFTSETRDILSSLKFDAERRGKDMFFSEHDLQEYFHRCDISGTVRGCLKICNEKPKLEPAFEPLGNAVRIHYNLRDLTEDVRGRLINVSQEDAQRLGISLDALREQGDMHPGVCAWRNEQVALGLRLLEQHRTLVKTLNIQPITRLILWGGYERPARRFLSQQTIEGIRMEQWSRARSTLDRT